MGKHSKLWLDPGENCASLFCGCVMLYDSLHALWVREILPSKCLCVDYFVNDYIRSLREVNEVFGETCVAGEHDRMPSEVDAVTKSRLDEAMIDFKSRNLDPTAFIHNSLLDVLRNDHDTLRG